MEALTEDTIVVGAVGTASGSVSRSWKGSSSHTVTHTTVTTTAAKKPKAKKKKKRAAAEHIEGTDPIPEEEEYEYEVEDEKVVEEAQENKGIEEDSLAAELAKKFNIEALKIEKEAEIAELVKDLDSFKGEIS